MEKIERVPSCFDPTHRQPVLVDPAIDGAFGNVEASGNLRHGGFAGLAFNDGTGPFRAGGDMTHAGEQGPDAALGKAFAMRRGPSFGSQDACNGRRMKVLVQQGANTLQQLSMPR